MSQKQKLVPTPDQFESLADYAHDTWCGWLTYLFEKSTLNEDGSVTIPQKLVERWERQRTTKYALLSSAEQESDRDEAETIIATINKWDELNIEDVDVEVSNKS